MNHSSHNVDHKEKTTEEWLSYKPLIILIIVCIVTASAQNQFDINNLEHAMYAFMGYFLIFLALFKFFDLTGFVDGFSTYDLITKLYRPCGYVYPFIEFGLGISYIAQSNLFLTNCITLIVMTISGIGAMKGVFSSEKIKCACLGTAFNIPLSVVSIIENFGMGAMAVYKLI